jgi:predicted aldo/keto reductase-like oxidoreductase
MRFPKKDGRIDEGRTEKQVISAIDQGVNYFDTAYIYPNSELTLGNILAKGYRDKVLIATKLPLPLIHSSKDMENILVTQLKRLQTDSIDYYLMHSVMTLEGWLRLKRLGVEKFLAKAKVAGKVRRIGFSYHGDKEQFKAIVDDYEWDFCQIQYNYMDESNQAGKEGLLYAASRNLGIVIMEPLRGGSLAAKMPSQIGSIWERAEIKRTPAEWALRWIWNHPGVSVVLSGMNEESHIEENIRMAGSAYPGSLSAGEIKLFDDVKKAYAGMMKVGCTGCGYCMPCPAGVNIPLCFAYYNNKHLFNEKSYQLSYTGFTIGVDSGKPSYASLCRDCGKCEKRCPQSLPIRKHLREVSKDMEPFYFKPVAGLVRAYYKIRGVLKRANKTTA